MDNTVKHKPRKSTFSIRLTDEKLKEVERIAHAKNWSRNQTIAWLIAEGQKVAK